jgi:hypothetical protein
MTLLPLIYIQKKLRKRTKWEDVLTSTPPHNMGWRAYMKFAEHHWTEAYMVEA